MREPWPRPHPTRCRPSGRSMQQGVLDREDVVVGACRGRPRLVVHTDSVAFARRTARRLSPVWRQTSLIMRPFIWRDIEGDRPMTFAIEVRDAGVHVIRRADPAVQAT